MSIWETLGIAPTRDESAIRKAYAAQAKQWRPDSHPREFARLREAYEAALRGARAARLDTPTDAASAEAPTTPMALQDPSDPQPEAAPKEAPPSRYAAAEALVGELARCYSEKGESETVSLLHRQHESLTHQTIDARLEWETVFLHSLLTAAAPPVALLFEGDRLLRWRERDRDVQQMFGDAGFQRLGVLLEMANEAIYGRHFSRNRWHARLFGAAPLRWFGLAPWILRARGTAAYWNERAQGAGLESAIQMLQPDALRRIQGLLLQSTDVLLALLATWLAWSVLDAGHSPWGSANPWPNAGGAAMVFLVALPLPWAARWLRGMRPVQAVFQWRDEVSGLLWFIVGAVLFGIGMLFVMNEGPRVMRIAGALMMGLPLLAAGISVAWFLWMLLRLGEMLMAWPVLWLQRAWGVHAFLRVRDGYGTPRWREQLRQLPRAAVQDWKTSRARRKAQAAQRGKARAAGGAQAGKGGAKWWWIFVAIGLVNLLARLLK